MKKIQIAAYVAVILLLAANLYISFQMQTKLEQIEELTAKHKKSLPCESVPISWAVKYYDCANSLLLAMNVTNIKFEPPGTATRLKYKELDNYSN